MAKLVRLITLFVLMPAAASAQTGVLIREWDVPTPNSRPHDPAAAPDGALWYTGQTANTLGRLDPNTGQIREYRLPISNSGPHGLVADRDGFIWYTGNSAGHIGRLNPATGSVTSFPMPDPRAGDPHTPVFDQQGILWFTVQNGNFVGKLDPRTGTVSLKESPTANSRPYGIVVNAQGVPFFCENGTNKIGRINPGTLEITEYTLPQGARPRRLAVASGGLIYYTSDNGRLGQLDPVTGQVRDWPSPAGPSSAPYAIAATADGMVWYFETGMPQNMLVRFDPRTENFERYPIASGGGVVRHMVATPEGHLYLACSGVNKVGIAYLSTSNTFTIANRGSVSWSSTGSAGTPVVGYARVQPNAGSSAPSGMAIFSARQNNVLVSEAAVPAAVALRSGRIPVESGGPVRTGVAIANPADQPVAVSFYFTDRAGRNFGEGTVDLPAGGQIARFLDEPPFNGGTSMDGTFTFNAALPVGAVALRGLTNERSEFLLTTVPVVESGAGAGSPVLFPHFADGGGWMTQVVLVNPGDESLTGTAQFFSPGSANTSGEPLAMTVNGEGGTSFAYSVAPRSAARLVTSGSGSAARAGSVRATPSAGSRAPAGLLIVSYRRGGVTVSEAGIQALPAAAAFRLFAEGSGDFNSGATGSMQTGLAVANPASSAAEVSIEVTRLDGAPMGSGRIEVPAQGHAAMFLNQITGLETLPFPFQGVVRIASASPGGIAVTGLRGRFNERGDFLIAATAPVSEASPPSSTELLFPHLVDGGGYATQFVLFSAAAGQPAGGTLRLVTQSGQSLNLALR